LDRQQVEDKLRELLVPVLGRTSAEEIMPEKSLVLDLGADSMDFVEIIYLVEKNFGVVLKIGEIITGGTGMKPEDLFVEGRLTEHGAGILRERLAAKAAEIKPGLSRVDLFGLLTVRDLSEIIAERMKKAGK
jgi:acyl carrier protein